MATKDFRASQVRLTQIIGSGSESGKPSILVVSASDSSGYEGEALSNSALLANVGTDVFMFVTGSKNTRTDVTLFGGDVVISGTMYAERQVVEVDLSATGSLSVSGSLIVSQSATIHEGLIVNESGEGDPENDLRVESENKTHALFVDASKDQVLILSGGGATSFDEGSQNDVAFYVSGAVGSKGTSTRGTSVFGGDVVTSGVLEVYGAGAASIDIARSVRHIGDLTTQIAFPADGQFFLDAESLTALSADGPNQKVWLGSYGLGSGNPYKFDQVLVLSGGGATSFNEAAQSDVAFYVSGSQGSKGSSTKGTAVFGGDVVVSGALYTDDLTITDDLDVGDDLTVRGELIVSQYVSHLSDSNTRIDFQDNDVKIQADGTVVIQLDGDSGQKSININNNANDVDFIVYADALGKQLIKGIAQSGNEQVLILSGGSGHSADQSSGEDVAFFVSGSAGAKHTDSHVTSLFGGDTVISGTLYALGSNSGVAAAAIGETAGATGLGLDAHVWVSGSMGSRNTSTRGTSIFGGDVMVSGAMVVGTPPTDSADGSLQDFVVNSKDSAGIIKVSGQHNYIQFQTSDSSGELSPGGDTFFHVSGTSGGKDSTGVAVFGGDVVISGSIWGTQESGSKTVLDFTADQLRFQNRNGRSASTGDDTNFYISGSRGSKNSATDRGTAVFGGDVVVSGTLYDGNGNPIGSGGGGGSSTTGSFNVPSPGEFVTTASLSVAGGLGFSHTADASGADAFFFVSGSVGQKGEATGKTAVFGGDTVVSGALYAETALHVTAITSSLADDTNMHFGDNSGTGYILFNVDGSEKVRITNGNGIEVQNTVSRIGDSNTKIHFSDDKISIEAGGKAGLVLSESEGDHSDIIYLGGPSSQYNRWDQVLILSGGGINSPNESEYMDVNFFVSGAVGGKGGDDHNVSLFGGDVVVSGAMYLEEISAPGTIPDGAVVLYGKDDSGVTKLYFKNESGEVEVGSGGGGGTVTTGSFNVPGQGEFVTTASLSLAGGEGFTHTANHEGSDLYFFVSGSKGKKDVIDSAAVSAFGGDVVISGTLYGGVSSVIEGTHLAHRADVNIIQGGSIPSSMGADISTFISGAIDWKGTSNARGTTVVGGDLLSSGTLFIDNSAQSTSDYRGIKFINDNDDSNAYFHINLRSKDTLPAVGGANSVNIQNRGAGSIMIGLGTGSLAKSPASFLVTEMAMPTYGSGFGGANRNFLMTSASHGGQVYILSGGAPTSVDPKHFTDTSFFVSGTIGSKDGSGGGVAVFGGDVVISGTLHGGSPLKIDGGLEVTGTMELKPPSGDDAIVRNPHGPVKVFASSSLKLGSSIGQIDFLDLDDGAAGAMWLTGSGGVANRSISLNTPGTLFMTGATGGTHFKGQIRADDGISGSLTQLTDGTPYLIAGDNITISTGSSGAVTINAAAGSGGGSGDPSATYIVLSATGSLNNERVLTAGSGISLSDAGAGGALTIASTGGTVTSGSFNVPSPAEFVTTASLSVAGGKGMTYTADSVGSDAFFFVSGTIGSKDSSTAGTAVFGGDLLSSGTIHLDDVLSISKSGDKSVILKALQTGGAGGGSLEIQEDSGNAVITVSEGSDNSGQLIVNGDFANVDFVVNSSGGSGANAIKVDASTDQVLILSGGGATSYNEATGDDVNFYVSGTVGSRGTSTRGAAVFGGDVVISGTLHGQDIHVSEYIYHSGDTDSNTFIQFAEDSIGITAGGEQLITVSEAGQDIVKIGDGGDVDFQVRTDGDDNTLYVQGSSDRVGIGTNSPSSLLHLKESAPTLSLQRESNSNDSTVAFIGSEGSTGAIMHISSSNDLVFKTHNGSAPEEMFRIGSHWGSLNRQIIFLSGSGLHEGAMQPKNAADIAFFVSGAIGSRGTSTKGTAVFGGDLYSSGSVYASTVHASTVTSAAVSGSLTKLSDGTSYLIAGSNVTITTGSSGAVTITSADTNTEYTAGDGLDLSGTTFSTDLKSGGGLKIDSTELAVDNTVIATLTGSTFSGAVTAPALSGSLTHLSDGTSYLIAGSNVTITTGSSGAVTIASSGGGVADAVGWSGPANQVIATSGSLTIGTTSATPGDADIFFASNGAAVFNEQGASVDFRVESNLKENALLVDGSTDQVLILSGGGATSYNEAAGADVNFYVSGTADNAGSANRGTSVFGGDLYVSGGFYLATNSDPLALSVDHTTDRVSWFGGGSPNSRMLINNRYGSALDISSSGVVVNEIGAATDFRVESRLKANALLVDGSTDQVLILSGGAASSTNEAVGSDVAFYVSGSTSSASTSTRGTSLFGGDVVASGTILPGADLGSNLGAPSRRFGNIYTGDLHLRNDRGDWTIVEEADYLCVVNNLTGKKFKMALIPLDENE